MDKYFIVFITITLFFLLMFLFIKKKSLEHYINDNYGINFEKQDIFYPYHNNYRVVTWSPSYVDNYYQPGYNQYFYNNGYYYPVY